MNSKTKRVTITLPETLIKEIKDYAEKNGATFSGLVRISTKGLLEGNKDEK